MRLKEKYQSFIGNLQIIDFNGFMHRDRPVCHQCSASEDSGRREDPWNNGKEVPRWGVAGIQKMSLLTTGICK